MWNKKLTIHEVAHFSGGCGLFDMNDKGQAVGQGVPSSGIGFALLWSKETGVRNLNKEIPKNSGWFLSAADSINLSGQITGWGTVNGETHGFLLTPRN